MVGMKRDRSGLKFRYTPRRYVKVPKRTDAFSVKKPAYRPYSGTELKFYDTFLNGGALTATDDATAGEHDPATLLCLNGMAQDSGMSDRDGRLCTITHVEVHGHITEVAVASSGAVPSFQSYFVAIILDTQANGAVLASEDVFDNPSSATALCVAPFKNLKHDKRFKVLAWKRFGRPAKNWQSGNQSTSGTLAPFHLTKMVKIPVLYEDAAAGIGSITDNAIHVVAWAAAAAGNPLITYSSRVRFVG